MREQQHGPKESLKIFLCGGVAGMVAKTFVAPFDRVKIHFQIQNPELRSYSGQFFGVFKALRVIYRESGVYGLFRGHSAMLIRIFPYAAVNYYSYERLRRWLYGGRPADQVYWAKRILAGSCAGGCAVFTTYPLDLFRARLALGLHSEMTGQSTRVFPRFKTYRRVLRDLLSEGRRIYGLSVLGLYQGFWPTFFGIIPYAGVSFFSFESLKMIYSRHSSAQSDPAHIPIALKLPLGMLAGALAQTAAYPFDLVRRRSQVLSVAPFLQDSSLSKRPSPTHIASLIFKERGLRGFFVGLSINYLKVAPATGVSFIVYEFMRDKVFGIKRDQ